MTYKCGAVARASEWPPEAVVSRERPKVSLTAGGEAAGKNACEGRGERSESANREAGEA